ncbi:FliO/MopB family protein [Hydrogenophaga pseudoflava]|uniref:FliO/MopB family protein n=1 Tax=Hydrogenophaga pseudoflava TaxID=47421 RepID=UPI0027E47B6D|nr:flagellar biosynthetic protein FliO [Hydrogenophaga pseudoflava]MDQ7743609.1 flagellar biosynthetic protein FliO [Hydrogenophaga pseudoflava]
MLQNAAPAIVLLIVMVGIAWLLQRYRRHLPGAAHRAGPILQVLGGVALGPQQRVVTLQVGQGEQAICLVLGVSPGSVTALHQMPLPPEAPPATARPGDAPAPAGFAARLALFRKDGDANR